MPINANVTNNQITASVGETKIDVSVSGGFGPTGSTGTVAVSAPVTNSGTSTAAVIGLSVGTGLSVSGGSLVVTPGTYAAAAHTHSAADITSGTLADARISAAIARTATVAAALDGKAGVSHTHTASQITDFTSAVVAAAPPTTNASLLTSGVLPDARLSANIARTSDVSSAVAAVVNAAPAALDTLQELATALGNDASFSVTVTNALAAKAPINNPTFTGTVSGVTKSHVGLGNVPNVDATARANHTGTQAISTVSGLQTALDGKAAAWDGSAPVLTCSYQESVKGAAGLLDAPYGGFWLRADDTTVVIATTDHADSLRDAISAATASHSHGNLTNDGRIGTTSGQIVVTGSGGVLTTAATISASSVSGLATVATSGSAADLTGTLSASRLPTSGVTAGTYTSVTVDATGRVTAGSSPAGYTLPTATASVLGGVKIGSGISIDGNGVISASSGYTLPNATTSTLGGVIVGSGLSVASGTVSVSYGTTSSTACQGNDARLSDTRSPTAGSVTDASIASGGLSTSVLNWSAIAPWAASTAYAKGDLVSYLGIGYRRSAAGTSGATFNVTNWQQITPSEFVGSQITSGTIATARLGSGTADATTFLRGDQTYAAPFTYATTTQAFTGTSTTVVMSPARVRDWAKNWKLIVLSEVQRDITNTSSTGAFSLDSLRLRANNAFTTANATSVYRSYAPQFTQQYSTSDGNVGSLTNWGWSKGISFAARIAAGPTFSATGTARLQFGKRTATTTGQLDQQGIGVEVRGTTGGGNPRLWILAHNGTSLTQTDTGLNLTSGKIYDLVLSSDAAGTVTALVNDTAYTSSGGPTTDLLSPSNDSTISIEAANGSTSSAECSWYVSRHVWVATQ